MTTQLTLTATSARIPLAWATFNGQRVACTIDPEWARAFEDLQRRVGGTKAYSNTELAEMTTYSQPADTYQHGNAPAVSAETYQSPSVSSSFPDVLQGAGPSDFAEATWQR